jgi:hypothetical protein
LTCVISQGCWAAGSAFLPLRTRATLVTERSSQRPELESNLLTGSQRVLIFPRPREDTFHRGCFIGLASMRSRRSGAWRRPRFDWPALNVMRGHRDHPSPRPPGTAESRRTPGGYAMHCRKPASSRRSRNYSPKQFEESYSPQDVSRKIFLPNGVASTTLLWT